MTQAQEHRALNPENLGESLRDWLRPLDEPDRVFTKNKKIEVVFLVEAVNIILPRTEGVEDITLFKIPGTEYEVPVILPEKLQAVTRRNMLSYLRNYYDIGKKEVNVYLEKLSQVFVIPEGESKKKGKKEEVQHVGFIKAKEFLQKSEWNCYVQPPSGEETDVGMDGFCPACVLFGTVLDSSKVSGVGNISVGLKSRVEFDPAIAISDRKVSVVALTHNKVSDGVSWTGQSLFTEYHVVPGTVFVGKVTLEDVTEPELKAFLAVLATLTRLGGRERVFGGVRVYLVGIKGGSYETVSALELAKELVRGRLKKEVNEETSKENKYGEKLPDVGDIIGELKQELANRGFTVYIHQEGFVMLTNNNSTWSDLWKSTLMYDKQVLMRILQLQGTQEKYRETWKYEEVLGKKT